MLPIHKTPLFPHLSHTFLQSRRKAQHRVHLRQAVYFDGVEAADEDEDEGDGRFVVVFGGGEGGLRVDRVD